MESVPIKHPEKHEVSPDSSLAEGQQPHHETSFEAAPKAEAKAEPPSFANAPDGGLTAWLQVLGGYFLFFNTWGILNTFGVYQTYYESGELFQESSSNIAWIGSLQAVGVLLVGSLSGPLYDRGYLRSLLLVGSFLIVFGNMMLSLCHTFWQCILAQGFCIGIGAGALFVPAVAVLPTYFRTRLGLAMGIAASGSSTGGIIYPIVFYKLVFTIGFPWATRVLGFIALATLLVPIFVMKMRVKPPRARSLWDQTAWTDWPFSIFVLACLLGFVGLYVALFYTSFYGQAEGITDDKMSFYLVPILNAASVFGRTLPNWLSDKTGPLNIITPGAFICGILLLCFMAVHNLAGIIVNTLFIGFFSGVFIALPPVLFVALTADKTKVGTRIGMGFAFLSAGVLLGGPAAGAVLGAGNGSFNWTGTWVFGAVFLLASGCVLLFVRYLKVGWKVVVKI